jgi:hypothetical protein
MQKFFIIPMVVMLSGLSPVLARGGHGGGMHGSGMGMQSGMGMNGGLQSSGGFGPNARGGLSAPAEPTVPPSLTPDSRLATGAPLPPHQQPTRRRQRYMIKRSSSRRRKKLRWIAQSGISARAADRTPVGGVA